MPTLNHPVLNQPPECKIIDRYEIGHRHALLERLITYRNISSHDIQVESKSFYFPFLCKDFKCYVNNAKIDITPEYSNYVYRIIALNSGITKIKPGEELTIRITCLWQNFTYFLNTINIHFVYPDKATYTLNILGLALEERPHIISKENQHLIEKSDYFIQHNSIHFSEFPVSLNNPVNIKIVSVQTPKEINLISYYSRGCKADFSNYVIVLIQHLLSDFTHLVQALLDNHADLKSILVLGIPYSTKDYTVEYLKELGIQHIEAPIDYPFDSELEKIIKTAIEIATKENKKIIIIEDGGYAVPLIHEKFISEIIHFQGAVEQTANGIWRDKKVSGLKIPVLNVAESSIKLTKESPLIGQAVIRNIEILIGKEYIDLNGKEVGIMGYGSTGSKVAEELKKSGAKIKVFDINEKKRESAHNNDFMVVNNAVELVSNSDVLIETTGTTWCKTRELLNIKHRCYFINASSKRMGIDYSDFNRLARTDSKINVPGIGVRYSLNEKEITLLADGYPVNFFLGESVPDKAISFIIVLLFRCAEFLAGNDYNKLYPGIIDLNKNHSDISFQDIQDEINSMHNELH